MSIIFLDLICTRVYSESMSFSPSNAACALCFKCGNVATPLLVVAARGMIEMLKGRVPHHVALTPRKIYPILRHKITKGGMETCRIKIYNGS